MGPETRMIGTIATYERYVAKLTEWHPAPGAPATRELITYGTLESEARQRGIGGANRRPARSGRAMGPSVRKLVPVPAGGKVRVERPDVSC
jgi:hypothetical protein